MPQRMDSAKIRYMVLMGLLFAIMLVLSYVESAVQFPMLAPGIKLGLSNIVVMYSLFFLKKSGALVLAVLKSLFVLLTRGLVAAILSFCGGILSISVMILLMLLFKERISYLVTSIAGAIFHNLGQLTAISLLYTNLLLWTYLPVLLVAGVIAGTATAALLKTTLSVLGKLNLK